MEDSIATQAPSAEEFPMYAHYRNDQLENEGFVENEIDQLWLVHQCCSTAVKSEQTRQRAVGNTLGQLLYRMKAILSTPGRGGKWSKWLRERQISRASGDRWVQRYVDFFHLSSESTHEAIPEPSEAQINALFASVWPRCEKTLTTPRSRFDFLRCFFFRSGLVYDFNERGILLYEPGFEPQRPEVVASEPQTITANDKYGDVL